MRNPKTVLTLVVLSVFLLSACSVREDAVQSSAIGTTGGVDPTGDGESAQMQLWSRGPVQASSFSTPRVKATDGSAVLNSLPRQTVTLYNLASATGKLSGTNLKVLYRENDLNSPSIGSYASTQVPWSNRDFQAFMTYAHGSGAYKYIRELYPTLAFKAGSANILPITAYSDLHDSAFLTRYAINRNNRPGTLMFYRESTVPNVPYSTNDEADAIYHEVGHSLQHALNKEVLETVGNYDTDMLVEALADFFAASALQDDQILQYLASNASSIFESSNRTGTNHDRRLGGDLYFPKSYVGEFHLDGRVISSALNDVRKFLQNQSVTIYQPSAGTLAWGATNSMTKKAAFDHTTFLAYESLRDIIPTSTLIFYSQKLIARFQTADWSAECGTDAACKSRLVSGVTKILISRGIYKTTSRSTAFTTGDSGEITFGTNLYAIPLGSSSGISNQDNLIDRCEAMLLIPNYLVATGVNASAYDIKFELTSSSNLTSLYDIDNLDYNAPLLDDSQMEMKIFGFVLPTDASNYILAYSGRFYDDQQGSHLTSKLISSANPSQLGWAARVPSTAAVSDAVADDASTGSITYTVKMRPFEVLDAKTSVYTTVSKQQVIHVSHGAMNCCDGTCQ